MRMGRTLCTIQTIKDIQSIPGKDKIGLASFESTGWKVIVDKTSMRVGEKVVYCEYDTLLPPRPEFEFLRARCWNEKWQGHRISAMKMAGVISEGICFPLSILPTNPPSLQDNTDVTSLLGARKYDPESLEEKAAGNKKNFFLSLFSFFFRKKLSQSTSSWPKFLPPKTDETRIQVIPEVFNYVRAHPQQLYYTTEKLDGSSVTIGYVKRKFIVCSRNIWYRSPSDCTPWEIANQYQLNHLLKMYYRKHKKELVLQGEAIGPKIQGNKYHRSHIEFYIFNIWDASQKKYLSLEEMEQITQELGLKMVPVLSKNHSFLWETVDDLIQSARGFSFFHNNTSSPILREGIVIRPMHPTPPIGKMSNMWSFKVINPDFLISSADKGVK